MNPWLTTYRCDPTVRALADRHYSRQKAGSAQFIAPGRPLVLVSPCGRAGWVSLYQRPEYTDHAWPGAWVCVLFRNEGAGLSSDLVRAAVAATRAAWGEPPALGMLTFVAPDRVRPKRDPGMCFLRAGFHPFACTVLRRRLVLRIDPRDMPPPEAPPAAYQRDFF